MVSGDYWSDCGVVVAYTNEVCFSVGKSAFMDRVGSKIGLVVMNSPKIVKKTDDCLMENIVEKFRIRSA